MRTLCLLGLLFGAALAAPLQLLAGTVTQPRDGVAICALEIAHLDAVAALCSGDRPLPDGCPLELIEDVDRDGEVSAADRMLLPRDIVDAAPSSGDLRLNGTSMLGAAGCFLWRLSVELRAGSALYLRVYDQLDPRAATGFWQSPFYHPLPGFQQVSFRATEWTWYPAKQLPQPDLHPPAGARRLTAELAQPGQLLSYPNPFNSTTSLAFKLSEASPVKAQVYDLNGRLVRTLLDDQLEAGEHRLSFAADGLPSGTYMVAVNRDRQPLLITRVMLVK